MSDDRLAAWHRELEAERRHVIPERSRRETKSPEEVRRAAEERCVDLVKDDAWHRKYCGCDLR